MRRISTCEALPVVAELKDLDFGLEEAGLEAQQLHEYFVSTKQFEDVVSGEGWIVRGSKGSGKTALKIGLRDSTPPPGVVYVDVSPSTTDWDTLRARTGTLSRQARKAAWMLSFLSASAAAASTKLGIEVDKDAIQKELSAAGFGRNDGGSWRLSDLGIEKGLPSFKLQRQTTDVNEEDIRSARRVEDALHLCFGILSAARWPDGAEVRLLVDDLDEQWRGDAEDIDSVISLFQACQEVHRLSPHVRPIIFIRSDIWDCLAWPNRDYLNSALIDITWDKKSMAELVRKRIEWSLGLSTQTAQEALSKVFSGYVDVLYTDHGAVKHGYVPPWDFIITLIPRRPRDAVIFLNIVRRMRKDPTGKISAEDVRAAEEKYSPIRKGNIVKAEGAHLHDAQGQSPLNTALEMLRGKVAARQPWSALATKLSKDDPTRARKALRLLLEYGVCGLERGRASPAYYLDADPGAIRMSPSTGNTYYLDDEPGLLDMPVDGNTFVVIHPSLRSWLGIKPDRRYLDFPAFAER